MLRSWDGLDLKVVLKESHKDKDKKQQKTHRFSLRTKRNNRETLPPPTSRYFADSTCMFFTSTQKKTKTNQQNIHVLRSESSPPPTTTANPSPSPLPPRWAGLTSTQCGFMASRPSAARCMNSDLTQAPFSLRLCPPRRPLCSQSWEPGREVMWGWGGGDEPHNRNQWARRRPFCYSLSAHTPQCKWGREKRGRGRERGGRRRRECESERLSGEMFACVCVCVMQREREDVISWCLSKHKQSGLVVHMGPTTPSLLQSPQTKPKSSRAWGDAGGVFLKKKISSRRTEKQQQQKKRNTSSV